MWVGILVPCIGLLMVASVCGIKKKERKEKAKGSKLRCPRRRGVRFLGILKRLQSIPPHQAIRIKILKGQRGFSRRVRLTFDRDGKKVSKIGRVFSVRPRNFYKMSPFYSARRTGRGLLL